MDVFEPKLIYLTMRSPVLSRAQFTARWRQHAQLGMSLPRWCNIARYVHVDLESPVLSFDGLLTDHDGIGMIWHKSPAHRAAHLADATSKSAMEADERETFAAPIAGHCLLAKEIIVSSPDPQAMWKLTRFAGSGRPAVVPDHSIGHVRNEPLPPESGARWGLDVALVEEYWFATRQAALAAVPGLATDALIALGREVQLFP